MRRQPKISKKCRGEQARPGKAGEPALRGMAASKRQKASERRGLRQKTQPIPTGKGRFPPDGHKFRSITDEEWQAIKTSSKGWSGGEGWLKDV